MSRRSLNATVVLGALAVCTCSVYSPSDLIGSDTFGDGGHGGLLQGGSSGAGGSGAHGGTGTGGALAGGSSGKSTGGVAGDSTGGATTGGKASTSGGKGSTGGSVATGGTGGAIGGEDAGGEGGGTSGGSVGTGGSSGGATGGGTATTGGEATGGSVALPPELIDDMEDANQNIIINTSEMRDGAWYTAFGKGGAADPVPMMSFAMPEIVGTPGVAGSLRAMHFIGTGGTEWGAMAAFDFRASGTGAKVPYDSRTYKGITFWAKAAASVTIQVRIPIPQTTSGACATEGCENHYAASAALTTGWKKFTLLWTPTASNVFLQDPAWGYKTAFDRTQMLSVQFVVVKGFSADFWIDDVSFVP